MVNIGTIRFKGRCERHPGFDPMDGQGGIRGGCKRCQLLLEIYDTHARLVELMRKARNDAGPVLARRALAPPPSDDRQIALF